MNTATEVNVNEEGGLNLGRFVGAIRRQIHIVVGVSILVGGAAVLKAWFEPPFFTSRVELLTEPVTLETQIISATNPDTLSSREELVSVEADELKLKVLKSPRILSPVVNKLQDKYPDLNYNSLAQNLDLKTTLQSTKAGNILEIAYRNNDENQVRDVIREVANTYLNYSLETRQSDIQQGITFLDQQLPTLRKEVDLLQEKLQQLRQRNNLIDPVTQAELLSTQLDSFKKEQEMVRVDLAEARMLNASQQAEITSNTTGKISASILETERYQNLKQQLLSVDAELTKQSAIWTEETPQIQLLREQRENLLSLLNRETQQIAEEVQIRTSQRLLELTTRDQALTQAINGLESKIKRLSATTREYSDLQRDLEIATTNLTQFITKRGALRIDAAQNQIPWEMLTPPNEPQAQSPSVKRNLVLGTVLGLLIGIACALGLDKLSDLIYTPEEIQEIINVPLLGNIPFNKKAIDSGIDNYNLLNDPSREAANIAGLGQSNSLKIGLASAFTEPFNSLYTNLCLATPDTPIKSLTISSVGDGEGKTTIASHLGLTAARAGQRVLLVDANLRNPELHKQAGLTNGLGLTDLIYRDNLDPHSVIQQFGSEENLCVLTCGPLPPDPLKLLGSEKIKILMKELHDSFDLVIYDAPSLAGLADTYLLANKTEGIVLVTALGQIRRSELDQVHEKLAFSRTKIWGIVANKGKNGSNHKSKSVLEDFQILVSVDHKGLS